MTLTPSKTDNGAVPYNFDDTGHSLIPHDMEAVGGNQGEGMGAIFPEMEDAISFRPTSLLTYVTRANLPGAKAYIAAECMNLAITTLNHPSQHYKWAKIQEAIDNEDLALFESLMPAEGRIAMVLCVGSHGAEGYRSDLIFSLWAQDHSQLNRHKDFSKMRTDGIRPRYEEEDETDDEDQPEGEEKPNGSAFFKRRG